MTVLNNNVYTLMFTSVITRW